MQNAKCETRRSRLRIFNELAAELSFDSQVPYLEVCVARGDNSGESRDCQRDAALVLVGVPLDKRVNERDGGSDHSHVLVIKQVDDARCPFATRDYGAVGTEQAEQAKGGGLLHHIESITREKKIAS